MNRRKVDKFVEENYEGFSFKRGGSPEELEKLLLEYAEEAKHDRLKEKALTLLERKKWAENGFTEEDFKVDAECRD